MENKSLYKKALEKAKEFKERLLYDGKNVDILEEIFPELRDCCSIYRGNLKPKNANEIISECLLVIDYPNGFSFLPPYDEIIRYFIDVYGIFLSITSCIHDKKIKYEVTPILLKQDGFEYPINSTDGSTCIPELFDTYEQAQAGGLIFVLTDKSINIRSRKRKPVVDTVDKHLLYTVCKKHISECQFNHIGILPETKEQKYWYELALQHSLCDFETFKQVCEHKYDDLVTHLSKLCIFVEYNKIKKTHSVKSADNKDEFYHTVLTEVVQAAYSSCEDYSKIDEVLKKYKLL